MKALLVRLFGANFKSSAWGLVTLVSGAVALHPEYVVFLPDTIEGWVKGICGIIALITGSAFVLQVKDKNVTGGNVQQTLDGAPAKPGTQTLVDITKESPPAPAGTAPSPVKP